MLHVTLKAPLNTYLVDLLNGDEWNGGDGYLNEDEENSAMNTLPNAFPYITPSSPCPTNYTNAESVRPAPLTGHISPILLAFGLWCESTSISITEYRRLQEVWRISSMNGTQDENLDALQLPEKLDTLKRKVRTQLPMLRLMRKLIKVTIEKQPNLPPGEKSNTRLRIERKAWHY
jgi:hypothetical protein